MIKYFVRYYKNHMPLFLLDFTCAFLMAGLDLVFPTIVRKTIDEILPSKNFRLLMWVSVGLLVLYILRAVFQYIVDYWGHVLGVRVEYDMREDLFNHINKLSFSYFDNTKIGHIMSRIVNDLNEISELAHHGPEDLFIIIVTLLGSFIILLNSYWPLALIVFSIIPIMIVFAVLKNKKMQSAFREMRLKIADVNAQVEDSISGVRVVKSFTNEWYEEKKFERGNINFKKSRKGTYKVMAEFFSGITFFSNLINVVIMAFGGIFMYMGRMTSGMLVEFLLYVTMFLQPIRKFTTLIENYQNGMSGFARFIETMEIEPDIKDAPNAVDMENVKGEIVFDDVTFSYNRENVLENISLSIKPGETIAFVGPSGGGKTTLCSLIPRFYEVDKGRVMIDGMDVKAVTKKSLRKNIGIVQQDVFLFSGTVRENIAYGNVYASDEEIIEAAKKADAHEFIMNLEDGYDMYIGERGTMLSGGQKQRISIARMFLKNPPILILDEATSALDSETEKIIQNSLSDLARDRTTLVIAHRLATIRNANKIVVLTDEGIAEMGTHKELLDNDNMYAKLYKAQFGGFMPEIL